MHERQQRGSDERRPDRTALTVSETRVRTRTRLISVVRSLLRREGIRVRSGAASTFVERVREVEVPAGAEKRITINNTRKAMPTAR